MRSRDRRPPPRDQHESAFAAILADLVLRVPGARCAALVDRDGETVDYAGGGNPYAMRVAAAHLRIVFDEAVGQPSLSATRSFLVRASRASFALHALPEGYALAITLSRGAGFRGLMRAVPVCIRRLADEAGWKAAASPWYPLDVLLDERGTPQAVRPVRPLGGPSATEAPPLAAAPSAEGAFPLEVLGRFRAALPEHERAWRVRTMVDPGRQGRGSRESRPGREGDAIGTDFTLVRESNGFWYADEPVFLPSAARKFGK
jgi:hypothetical protein